jgi:hypothetical protein
MLFLMGMEMMDKSLPAGRLVLWARVKWMIIISAVLALLLLFGLEIYFRRHQSYIVRNDADTLRRTGLLESDPEYLIQYDNGVKSLIPNAHVVIMNHRLSGRDIRMDINSLGFRDREIPATKKENEVRILFLGDSITVGDYLDDNEVFVERAEYYLRRDLKGRAVEAINAGIGDVGTKEEIDILERRCLQVDPDVVALDFYLNDSRPPWGFPGELGSSGFIRRHSVLAQVVYRELMLRNWVKEKGEARLRWPTEASKMPWKTDPALFFKFAELAEYDWGAAFRDDSWKVIDIQLARLKALSQQYGFKVAVIVFPVKYQVYTEYLEDKPQRLMEERARKMGFYYLDLLPLLREKSDRDLFFDQCHPNREANDIIGRAIADFLRERVLPGP